MNYKLLVDTAMLAGEIMLQSGAETYRVEDTMSRILQISGFEKTETFVTPTGFFLTLDDASIDTISLVKRVENRATNLTNIYEVNNISRSLCAYAITIEEAYEKLKELKCKKQYKSFIYYISTVLAALSFTVLLGGSWINCLIAGLNGSLTVLTIVEMKSIKINGFIKNMMASILIGINSMLALHLFGDAIQIDILIGGSIMPLLPGVALTNAIRDTLQGDFLSGGARTIEAFISATATAAGVGVGVSIYSFFAGGLL
ncbi:MAG: hypothetical protein K0R92_737 [Lachnospiraceae bacterium]|jgi:uncharacterized membrane protein YjjP (DUF1212 family)|nr:hypothetical protein [Lachnospiraceae bacterium]